MAIVLIAGLATLDFVFDVHEMPSRAEKYRARDARMIGGGGAANAAVAVARLGGQPRLAARLGDDEFATMIVDGLEAEGVDCSMVRRYAGRRSSFSSVLVDRHGERQIVNFRDDAIEVDAGWIGAAAGAFDVALSDTRWPEAALETMRLAKARGAPGVMDAEAPVRLSYEALCLASHVAYSAQGLRDQSGEGGLDADGLRRAASEIGGWVAVTRGEEGVAFLDGNHFAEIGAFPVSAVETLAAGDVWHGAFALGLGEGREPAEAIRFANAAAALKCARRGGRASYPTRAQVDRLMKEQP